jgi:hypothetical protein
MAQNSRFWVTSATPTGDQQASYSGADFADVWRAMGEGVISGHSLPALDGELACSAGGANTVNVADGAAIVDGIYFESTAVENVNVPSAIGEGNTRIDRIVVRANWSSYEAKITRIAGTDAATPSAPAITQTTETTYDLPLCQVLVDTSGNVTVTDERDWFMPITDARIYSGRVVNNGTPIKLPSGWSSTKTETGKYKVTHNFGSGNYTVIITPLGEKFAAWNSKIANSFDVYMYSYDPISQDIVNSDGTFDFIVIRD